MASRRWVITTPPPKTATCPRCRRTRNRLSVYPTFEGKACFSCLASSPSSDRSPDLVAASTAVEPVAAQALPRERPTSCRMHGCGRLPGHNGDHRSTLRRTGAAAPSVAVSIGA